MGERKRKSGEVGKGLFHAILTVLTIAEMPTAKSKLRQLFLGACAGWHLACTVQHYRAIKNPGFWE